jgi:outer membrane protein assembly factor BamD
MKKIILFVLSAALLTGCGLFRDNTEKTATELITEARQEFNDEDYLDAVELFEKLKNWYPFSEHVKEAEIKIADSYFEMRKYMEAIRAYQTFERLHPLDKEAERSAFRIGESYYKQILSIDRDQSYTQKALKSFIRFINNYPGSKLVPEAKKYADDCIKKIAESELYVGNFYFKQKKWEAAKKRLNDIVKNYPGTDTAKKAKELLDKIPETESPKKE